MISCLFMMRMQTTTRSISAKFISSRQTIIGMKRNVDSMDTEEVTPGTFGRCELDSHAYTCSLGANFAPLYYTGQQCDITPFSSEYEATPNISVVSRGTAWTNPESGITYILVINKALWFGSQMKHSLLNPNQLSSFGINLCDDPYDPNRGLRMVDPDNGLHLPFMMKGTIIYLDSRFPTQEEFDNCQHITLTHDKPWNPQNIQLGLNCRSPEEEE